MKRIVSKASSLFFQVSLVSLLLSPPLARSAGTKPSTSTRQHLAKVYGHLPLSFEGNRGQTDSRVRFLSRGPGYTLFLTQREAVLRLRSHAQELNNVRRNIGVRAEERRPSGKSPRMDPWFSPASFSFFPQFRAADWQDLDSLDNSAFAASRVSEPRNFANRDSSASDTIEMKLVGANPNAKTSGED
jgi:hypothetical protein